MACIVPLPPFKKTFRDRKKAEVGIRESLGMSSLVLLLWGSASAAIQRKRQTALDYEPHLKESTGSANARGSGNRLEHTACKTMGWMLPDCKQVKVRILQNLKIPAYGVTKEVIPSANLEAAHRVCPQTLGAMITEPVKQQPLMTHHAKIVKPGEWLP